MVVAAARCPGKAAVLAQKVTAVMLAQLLVLAMCGTSPGARAANDLKFTSETKLRNYLRSFDVYVPPVDSAADFKNFVVNLTVRPENIFGMRLDTDGQLWMNVLMCLHWNSSALTWDPADFGNVSYITLFKHRVWKPLLVSESHVFLNTLIYGVYSMSYVLISHDGLTEWCPQVRLLFSCHMRGSGFDAFPADEFECSTRIISVIHGSEGHALHIENLSFFKEDFRRKGDLFGNSGYHIQFMRSHDDNFIIEIDLVVRRNALDWLYQMTLPVLFVSLLCLVNLWLYAVPHEAHGLRRLSATFALIVIIIVQIQLYSLSLVHCSRPPLILSLLSQLACGQVAFAMLYLFMLRLDDCQMVQTFYQRAHEMYAQIPAYKYLERARSAAAGWNLEKLDDNDDQSERHLKHSKSTLAVDESGSLAQAVFLLVRVVLTAQIAFNVCRFVFVFL